MHAAGNDRTPAAAGDDTRTMIFTLAVGVGLAIVALAAGTFFVFRNE